MHGKEIAQYIQNYKRNKVDQGHPKKLIDLYKLHLNKKTLKQPVYFLRAVELWPTFDIQISITLDIVWEKLQNYTF